MTVDKIPAAKPDRRTFLKVVGSSAGAAVLIPGMAHSVAGTGYPNLAHLRSRHEHAGTAVAYNRFGKGQSVYLGVPIFRAMQWRPFWIREWIPDLMKKLLKHPIAELRAEPFSEYVHGTFFYDKDRKYILVQVLNTIDLATEGEYRGIPRIVLSVDEKRLNVNGAKAVWPKEENLTVREQGGRKEIVLQNPPRYMALFLKLTNS